jgi:hypothetical protein
MTNDECRITNSHCLMLAICSLLMVPALLMADSLPPAPDTAQRIPMPQVDVKANRMKMHVRQLDGPDYVKAYPKPQDYSGKYILASVALPGAGEMWKGSRAKGEAFLWTDAAIWVAYGGLNVVGNSRNQAARLYARQFSGASATQSSDDYYVALERYPNSDLYNEDIRRTARDLYPLEPDKQKTYYESHGYFGDKTWNWGSDSLRLTYWDQRRGARDLLHTAGFFLGAAVINRLVSAVDVAFFTPDKPRASGSKAQALLNRFAAVPATDRPGLAVGFRF